MNNKVYYAEIPFVRAVACLLVVMVHVTAISYNPTVGFTDNVNLYLNQFSRFGTPVFAVISSFLLYSSVQNKGFNFKKFLYSRTTKIMIPFFFWTLFYLGIQLVAGTQVFINFKQILSYFIFGEAYYHLYFMVLVIQFYFVFPLLQKLVNKKNIIIVCLVSLLINFVWVTQFLNKNNISFYGLEEVIIHRSFLLNWIFYFSLGFLIAIFYKEILTISKKYKWLILILFIAVLFLNFNEINTNYVLLSSKPSNLIYIPLFILFLLSIYGKVNNKPFILKFFNLIGKYSMGIYLVHPFVILVLYKILPAFVWESYLILFVFILTITISIILNKVILRLPYSNYLIAVGKGKKQENGVSSPKKYEVNVS